MKKIILSLALLIGATQIDAQSFIVKDENGTDISGQTVSFNSSVTMSQVEYHAKLQNISSTSKTVKVKRIKITEAIFAINDFCWTSCYDPSTNVSPFGIAVPAGATDTNFVTHYTHGEEFDGTSTYISLCFLTKTTPTTLLFLQLTLILLLV